MKWVVSFAALGVAYLSEKWASQQWPLWPKEWLGLVVFFTIMPVIVNAVEPRVRKLFLSSFNPQTASGSEVENIRVFIGVDNFAPKKAPDVPLTDEQKRIIKENKDDIIKRSSLTPATDQEAKSFLELKNLHFPASYGTLGLIKSACTTEHGFKWICLLVTENVPAKQREIHKTYVKEMLTALGIVTEEAAEKIIEIHYDETDPSNLNVEHIQWLLQTEANRISDKLSGDERLAIDTTAGTALHTIAALKISESLDALVLYNGSKLKLKKSLNIIEV